MSKGQPPREDNTKTGALFVVSAPSGAGKTSLLKALMEQNPSLALSISHTTRPIRPGEKDGVHYHFTDIDTFQSMIAAGEFIEHANVFGHHYGTARTSIALMQQQGIDTLLEIDWQGAQQVRALFPEALSIFILPPSLQALQDRLERRQQDPAAVIEKRLIQASADMTHYQAFDYLVINDDFATALSDLQAIIQANQLTQARQAKAHAALLQSLLGLDPGSIHKVQ